LLTTVVAASEWAATGREMVCAEHLTLLRDLKHLLAGQHWQFPHSDVGIDFVEK